MASGKRIVLVTEDGICREESARYALELATRLRSSLQVLMLCSATRECDEEAAALCDSLRVLADDDEAEIFGVVRHGDKASELIKAIVSGGPVEALVWGGAITAVSGSTSRQSRHWFARVRRELECPVVIATKRVESS